jgi:RND family efflux transporter MFP subunit
LDDRQALAEVDKASNAVAYAEEQFTRQDKLAEMDNTSARAFQEARQQLATARADLAAAQAGLALVQLRSPLDGVVARIRVQPGQAVDLNTIVADIVDPGRLIVSANVSAAEAGKIQEEQAVEVMPAGDNEAVTPGKVSFVSPQVDPKTGTVLVRISLAPNAGLSLGRFVEVRIITEVHRDRLAVPVASVYTDHDGQSTLSVVQGDTAIQKVVQAGLRDQGLVEVQGDGLAEGMTVVTVGSYALPQETRVHVVASPEEVK